MVIRPLDELYHWDLTGKAMGLFQNGCPMPSAVVTIFILIMAVTLMTEYDGEYPRVAETKHYGKGLSLQKEPKRTFLGQSQDILNIVFDGTNAFLPSIYNEFGGGEDDPSKRDNHSLDRAAQTMADGPVRL